MSIEPVAQIPEHIMPQNSNTSNNQQGNAQPSGQSAKTPSDYRVVRDAGFDNNRDFMLSYGLRTYEPDDVAQSKEILQGFRDADAREQAYKDSSSSGNQK
ncbi:hypothetical protein G7054_g6000 [Neopestalotiopsis clavispora]|nr:hypothetical protein G7054_g6000 [Neopestalotiopsis clavispora]